MSPDDHSFSPSAKAKADQAGITIVPSVCPHDCTSTCALEVRTPRQQADRPGARLAAQRLHRGRDLREGRALRRAHPPSRPADEAAAPGRSQGLQAVRRDLLERRARHRGRAVHRQGPPAWQRDDLALLLRRHDGPGATRRHQPSAPRDEILALVLDHLRDAVRHRLDRGRGRQARRRRARGRPAFRPGRDLGRQSGEHPGQRHDPRHEGQEAWRQAGRGRSLSHRHGPSRPTCTSPCGPAPTARSRSR